jgi:hypothetical protein
MEEVLQQLGYPLGKYETLVISWGQWENMGDIMGIFYGI